MSDAERAWVRACAGDPAALTQWTELAKVPLREHLRRRVGAISARDHGTWMTHLREAMQSLATSGTSQADSSSLDIAFDKLESIMIDVTFRKATTGDRDAFAQWSGLAEPRLRKSLSSFSRVADLEAVLQETLLRMWIVAQERELQGTAASLRFAYRVARNLAIEEARHAGRHVHEDPPETGQEPTAPDPALHAAIADCVSQVPQRPRECLLARLRESHRKTDGQLAADLGMERNTLHQNLRRARASVRDCLASKGISIGGSPMQDTNRDALIERATSAFRERDARGRIRSAPAWWDLSEADREALHRRQLESREIERALDPRRRTSTVRAVVERI